MEFLPASSDENASAARPGSDNGITEKKTFRGSLRSANIDVEAGISYCAGDFEFYKVLLKQFSSEAEEKTASMDNRETPKEEEILEFSADKDALEFAPSDEIMEFDPVGEED